MEPLVKVAIIGTGDGGSSITTGTVGVTPQGTSNAIFKVVSPLMAIATRFVNLFLTTFVALSGISGISSDMQKLLGSSNFTEALHTVAYVALWTAIGGFLKDLITIFGKLEQKYPLLTGSI